LMERGDDMVRPQDKTVLVVDDEPNVREYLAQILQDAGFLTRAHVSTSGTGSAPRGSSIRKTEPSPSFEVKEILPPC